MDDFYIEQIVNGKKRPFALFEKALWIVLSIFLIGVGTLFMLWYCTILGLVVAFGGYYFYLPMLSVEYEYLYMSKELSVDKILNKEKRKKGPSFNLVNMELMAPAGSHRLDSYYQRKCDRLDFSSDNADADKYVIVINDKKNYMVTIEPNEELLKAISNQFPRKVFKD